MKICCSYAFTGEDQAQLQHRLERVVEVIEKNGHSVFCYHFSVHRTPTIAPQDALMEAIQQLKKCDILLAIVTSARKSEGQLMEVGAALSLGKPIVVAQHRSSLDKTYLPGLAEHSFVWNDLDDLIGGVQDYVTMRSVRSVV